MNFDKITKLFCRLSTAYENLELNKFKQNYPMCYTEFIEIDKYLISQYLLKLVKIVGYRPFPFDELFLMVSAFLYHKPDMIIDVGTHQGKSARIWFELARHFGTQTSIHTIDLFDPNHPEYPGNILGKYIKGTSVKQHIGDGFGISSDLIKRDPDANFLIFLDSDHSYENVMRELSLARAIKSGGFLVHDTFYQPGSNYNHGPYLAIRDFSKDFTFKQIIHLQTGLPGMSYLGLKQKNKNCSVPNSG